MKGATPCGPSVLITNKAPAPASPIGTGRHREMCSCSTRPGSRGAYCSASIRAIVPSTSGVTSSVGEAQPSSRRPSSVNAVVDRVGAEEDPPHAHERERREALSPHEHRGLGPLGQVRSLPGADRLPHAVVEAPEHEGPRGAVPQAAEHHRRDDVHVGAGLARLRPAERDVEVVAQPPRQRHVPSAPEVLQRPRRVRPVEVLGELEARAASRRRSRCRCSR